ncbi:MAG TPA: hypothetical protein VGO40_23955 [Longimicrobium sp.]|nr:hypothetical protein [Longimicrobium sp.]
MSRASTIAALALLALGACSHSPTATPPGPQPDWEEDSFTTPSLVSYAPYADGGGYNWSIQNGTLVASGPAFQAVLTRVGLQMTNGWVETVSSRADDGGLVLRFQSGSNYYLLAFRDDAAPIPRGSENLAVYHHEGTAYDQMWVKNVDWARGTSHTIRFEAADDRLRVYFDGVQQVELTPSPAINDHAPYTGAGSLGLRHYGADATWITSFDTFRWHIGA